MLRLERRERDEKRDRREAEAALSKGKTPELGWGGVHGLCTHTGNSNGKWRTATKTLSGKRGVRMQGAGVCMASLQAYLPKAAYLKVGS